MRAARMIPVSFEIAADTDDAEAIGIFVLGVRDAVLEDEKTSVPKVCGVCGAERGLHIPDACIGTLPGVGAACCGHGDPKMAYVSISMGEHHVVINGQDAIDWMKEIKEAIA